ncbi:protein HESO1 isoform X1 [Selaginella moellendorffii]|uniref:protein HESO1 isoform X1 n=1 Tax=Selaginella moellendorffii TaxID=88036 RepID=UPI000D1C4077|nr:protein HESO1 isoform X1 [Selaginella moellendorffii]XP_024535822.1 protein HESO1 isoform X1 [Selaginella moellendorffii]XP_024535823.1 protein HESO1 isoform X1 [Selaginella moellendorffii]|eukprot:XP_024535821.1 protein HESO1 isoform X1 [Selaginella moellendorffii]
MALDLDIAAIAGQLEHQRVDDFKRSNAAALFEGLLMATANQLQPTQQDFEARVDILRRLEFLIREIDVCKGLAIKPFGSFLSNLYTPWGDLDITLMPLEPAPLSRSKKTKILKSIHDALLQAGGAIRVQVLFRPRVPLLMFEDAWWRISCDISVSNTDAVFKSHALGLIVGMDLRCRQLIFLVSVKCWAKAQCINDPKMGTLNSYALSLLVIFHLQTRNPPILPPLSAIIGQGGASADGFHYLNRIAEFTERGFGKGNTSSVAELFVSFFGQFSAVEELWIQGLAVCTFRGQWGDKTTTDPAWASKNYALLVEDPFDLSENCSRSVHQGSLQHVCKAFRLTHELLCDKFSYWFLGKLKETLFRWPHASPRPCFHPSRPGIEQLREHVSLNASRKNDRPEKQKKGKKQVKQ